MLAEVSLTGFETNGEKSMTSNGTVKVLGKLGEKERLDINCAVKEYLMATGYKISAMTFQEEVLKRTLNSSPLQLCGLRILVSLRR